METDPLAHPQFFLPWKDLREGVDTEARVLEPLECGNHWILREALVGMKNEG